MDYLNGLIILGEEVLWYSIWSNILHVDIDSSSDNSNNDNYYATNDKTRMLLIIKTNCEKLICQFMIYS